MNDEERWGMYGAIRGVLFGLPVAVLFWGAAYLLWRVL